MPFHYRIRDNSQPYFITASVLSWFDIFSSAVIREIILNSLKYCQEQKGLEIYAWCLMPTHIHLVARAKSGATLSAIVRDFKAYTSKEISNQLLTGDDREQTIARMMESAAQLYRKTIAHKVWQDGYHPVELYNARIAWQKIDYVHNNPVKAKISKSPQEYEFSSARNYIGLPGLIEVTIYE